MKIEVALKEYKFANIGQFRAIAKELGYDESYNSGNLLFTKEDESFKISMNEIRNNTKNDISDIQNVSKEEVSKFFDKERANDPTYIKELSEKNISIVRWDGLKGEKDGTSRDGFTVIDHNNKVCYTGKSLYDYAIQNNNILDGKGTKLEKGVLSDMMEINGKQAKIRLTDNGVSVFYKKESLQIPGEILGHKLTKQEKDLLLQGDVVLVNSKHKNDIYLQVDKELNSVIVKTNKELSIPQKIGQYGNYPGYELINVDKHLLANGYSIDNKLLNTEKGWIIADISMSSDRKGIAFSNIQSISETKAKEIITQNEKANEKPLNVIENLNMDINKNDLKTDKEYLEQLSKNGITQVEFIHPIDEKAQDKFLHKYGLASLYEEAQTLANKILDSNSDLEKKDLNEKLSTVISSFDEKLREELNKLENKQEIKPEQNTGRDLDLELKEAINKNDFEKMASLKQEGYQPSTEVIKGLGNDGNLSEKQSIVIEKVFGIKTEDLQSHEVIEQKEKNTEVEIKYDEELGEKYKPTSEQEVNVFSDKDKELIDAYLKNDFTKITELKESGYTPSPNVMKELEKENKPNSMIAVEKIFGLKVVNKTLGDVKLAQESNSVKGNDISKPVANVVNRAFSDL